MTNIYGTYNMWAARYGYDDGVADSLHHYEERRALVDSVPDATLRMTPDAVRSAYPGSWRQLLGR